MKIAGTAQPSQTSYRWLPWTAVGGIFLVVFLYRSIDSTWIAAWPYGWQTAYRFALLVVLGAAAYYSTARLLVWLDAHKKVEGQLSENEHKLAESYQRIAAIFRLRQQFFEATHEQQVIDLLLKHSVELTRAAGASFVPLDERGRPLAAVHLGEPTLPLPDAWVEYLASPPVRDRCRVCDKGHHFSATCPLLQGPFSEVSGLYCLPLKRGEREFGVLNLYLSDPTHLTVETNAFLTSLIAETAQALETVWLRRRELVAFQQLQAVRQKADLNSLLAGMLENLSQAIDADLAVLIFSEIQGLTGNGDASPVVQIRSDLVSGELDNKARPLVEAAIKSVLATGQPLLQSYPGVESASHGLRALMAVALLPELNPVSEKSSAARGEILFPIGALVVANRRSQNFLQRHMALLQAASGQIGLVVQNARQLAELEYKTTMDERARLAREIHDGLAQTIGFLKLQVAQMQGYLDRGDHDRLRQGLRTYYQTLSEAYQDARYAIDGLRISPSSGSLEAWLQQMLAEFQENAGPRMMSVGMTCFDLHSELPSEVQAQLIRIVQEALSNVRKHSQAKNVWVSCKEHDGEIILEIQDDGRGFFVEDVPGPSQHGLRGMRERAELIGAEFQTISLPEQGTTVRISVPIKAGEVTL